MIKLIQGVIRLGVGALDCPKERSGEPNQRQAPTFFKPAGHYPNGTDGHEECWRKLAL